MHRSLIVVLATIAVFAAATPTTAMAAAWGQSQLVGTVNSLYIYSNNSSVGNGEDVEVSISGTGAPSVCNLSGGYMHLAFTVGARVGGGPQEGSKAAYSLLLAAYLSGKQVKVTVVPVAVARLGAAVNDCEIACVATN
jgi:hypothetical protein